MKTRYPYQKVYIAGPMSGKVDFNYPEFNKVATNLRKTGFEVINPAELDGDHNEKWEYYLKRDIGELIKCDAVAVLGGWEDSKGANLEVYIAKSLKIPVINAYTILPVPELTICEEANRLASHERQKDYGHPIDDFTCQGKMMAAILTRVLGIDIPDIPPKVVGMLMCAVKLSREAHVSKRDNRVDLAGYAMCMQMIDEYEKENNELA